MSRLDEIKARADAATEGPWVRDMHSPDMSGRSGWYIRGPRKLGLRSMVLNSRMLPGDAEFIEHAREDVPWLIERIGELNGAICWDTTCLNCSSLLDSNYDQYMRAEIAEAEVERLTDLCDEFRKREESQDCIRERLTAEVERLERWKFEACEVMSGLRELGRALGLGLGVQITGPAALAEVARLTAERDALAQIKRHIDEVRNGTGWTVQIYGVLLQQCDQYGKTIDTRRAERAEAERDALAGLLAEFVDSEPCSFDHHGYCQSHGHLDEGECHMARARAALAEADTTDTQPADQEVSDE